MEKKFFEILDTTLRDGEQMKYVSFSTQQKEIIACEILKIGVPRIEIASAFSVDQDKEAAKRICNYAKKINKLDSIEVLGFVDYDKSIDWARELGIRTINILAKGSEKHCVTQLRKTPSEHFNDIKEMIRYGHDNGMNFNVYLEDWSNGEMNSPNYVDEIISVLSDAGAKRVMLADTLGILYYWDVERLVKDKLKKFPNLHFDFHAHNDLGLATANTLAAIKAGVQGVHVTINRLGERAGNTSLFEVVANAKLALGIDLGIDTNQFVHLKKLVEYYSRIRLQPHEPFVGDNANIHTSSIHAHGDKMGNVYKTKTAEFFSEESKYSLGKQSGKSTIQMNLKALGLEVKDEIVQKVTKVVRELGGNGKIVTQEDLYLLVLNALEDKKWPKLPFVFLEVKADVSLNSARHGYVKISLNDEIIEGIAIGDGGFDAIIKALKECLVTKGIALPRLVDYRPSIPAGGEFNAIVATFIDWEYNGSTFSTVGIDTDQTLAAVRATEKMVNLLLTGYVK